MGGEHPRRTCRATIAGDRRAELCLKLGGGDRAFAQQHGARGVAEVEDRRFHADAARAAIEDEVDPGSKRRAHVVGGGRRDGAEGVGARGGYPPSDQPQHLERRLLVGNAQSDRLTPAGDGVQDPGRTS
ncbi:unannotated protein [freshwater metagenome]|uniref:Unannotated protein n=1 Tax=freshwater metagenome TaxID=449393 RepID=A0A6J7CVF0_9ZZZZ